MVLMLISAILLSLDFSELSELESWVGKLPVHIEEVNESLSLRALCTI